MTNRQPIRIPARVRLRDLRMFVLPPMVFAASLATVVLLWRSQIMPPAATNRQAAPARAETTRPSHAEDVQQTVSQGVSARQPLDQVLPDKPALAAALVSTNETQALTRE